VDHPIPMTFANADRTELPPTAVFFAQLKA